MLKLVFGHHFGFARGLGLGVSAPSSLTLTPLVASFDSPQSAV